ncbi:hypothetical protein JID35_002436 [Acinetobacter baumannii]|nr:hypothetical protein [Acinetobacter baumannii]EKY0376474.1 hypothetical protein [Acinetobacter baumannii]
MITFDPVPIGDSTFQMQELSFEQCLKISIIAPNLNEKRLTAFLKSALDNVDPLLLSVQERYLLLLKYLEKQSNTMLEVNTDWSKVFLQSENNWKTETTQNGITVRQLIGMEVEFLEANCKNVAEWIACMMAFQLSYSNHEHLALLPDRTNPQLFEEQFKQRLDFIKKMPASDFDLCYKDFNNLNNELFTHLRLSVDNHGILVERGADDAPARFRTASIFTGIIKELDRSFA